MVASIHSQAENDAVKKLLKGVSYLGATDTATNGDWVWADGTAWDYKNPSNDGLSNIAETHLAFDTGSTQWHDWSTGSNTLGVVCRKACGASHARLPDSTARTIGRTPHK